MSVRNFIKKKELFVYKNLFHYLKWRKLILKTRYKNLKVYNNNQFFLLVLYYFPFCFFFHFEEKDKKTFIDQKVNIYEELHQQEGDMNKVSLLTFNKKTVSKIKFFKDFKMFSGTFLCAYSQKIESLLNFYEQKQIESGIYLLFIKFYNRFVTLDYLFHNSFDSIEFFKTNCCVYQKSILNFVEYVSTKILRSFFNIMLIKKNAN